MLIPWAWQWLTAKLQHLDDSPEWCGDEPTPSSEEKLECASAREVTVPLGRHFPVVDLEDAAAPSTYANGIVKRTRFPRVKLGSRKVVVVLHQTGVERKPSNPRWPLVTGHRCIGPDGTRMRLHPLDVRLVAANALDRAPWHAISIEVAGNFEGIDGAGDWWQPGAMGRGRASDCQIAAARQEIFAIVDEVLELGAKVIGIVPHRISGRDAKGRPNRPLCPGSRVWSEVGEWSAATLDLAIPGPSWKLGGLPIPQSWHGPYRSLVTRFV